MNSTDLRILANGREFELMSQILDTQQMNGKHQSCPACGGTDRFRFDRLSNKFHCGGGGDYQSGDWLSLLFHIEANPSDAFNRANDLLGVSEGIDNEALDEARRLSDEKRAKQAKAKALRIQYDKQLSDNLYFLEEMITRRKYERKPDSDEIEQARYVIDLIKERYKINDSNTSR